VPQKEEKDDDDDDGHGGTRSIQGGDGCTENVLKQIIKGLDRPAPGGATPRIKTEQ